jgi:arylsulfatase A-like enzyme
MKARRIQRGDGRERSLWSWRTAVVLPAVVCSWLLIAAGPLVARAGAATSGRPDILIFLTDDQRAAGSMVEMPTVRRVFGQGGTRFPNGYVTTPMCCPSRASIFSGQYAHNTGIITDNGTNFDPRYTWERYLHQNGYYTGLIGKYLNGVPTPDAPYFNFTDPGRNNTEPEQVTIARAVSRFFAAESAHPKQPWALEVATYSPHAPWTSMPNSPTPVPAFVPPYKPPSFQEADRTDKDISVQKRSYPDQLFEDQYNGQQLETQTADEEFANLWNQIQNRNQGANLLSFFLSDNGYAWGDHGLWGKGEPYVENSRVPYYVRWPGHFAAGATDSRIAANIDIAPTIYQATGITPGYTVDGHSLLDNWQRQWLLLEFQNPDVFELPPWYSYLTPGDRQYIHWSDGFIENYDLRSDPAEMIASNVPDAGIEAKLDAAKTCRGNKCP